MAWQEWETTDFSEGLIDKVDDNLLPENAAADVQNFISTKIGSLKERPGQARLNGVDLGGPVRGLHAYYYGSQRRLMAAANGKVAYWDPVTEGFVDIKTVLNASAQTDFATLVNYLVAFNGVDAPWKWDGTTVSALANAPADGQFALLHKEKLFTVPASESSTLKWSDSFQPESWPGVNYWDVKKGDGDDIICLRKHLDTLVIFKRYSLHTLSGTNLDDFRLEEMDERIGCVGKFAAAVDGPYLYFVSDEGLCMYNGMQVKNLSEQRIPNLWKSINKEYIHKAVVVVWDGLIWFALPEGASTYNNLVIVYNPAGGKFWSWRSIEAACFQVYYDGVQRKLYSGDAALGFVNQQDTGTDDFGNPIGAYWEGKAVAAGVADRKNMFGWAVIQDSPGANDINLQVSLDYGNFVSLQDGGGDALVRRYDFFDSYEGRYLKPKLIHSALGGCEVRGLKVYFKPLVGVL